MMEGEAQLLDNAVTYSITNKQRNLTRKKRLEATKVELMEEDLDRIVIETSARVAESMHEQALGQQQQLQESFHSISNLTKQSVLITGEPEFNYPTTPASEAHHRPKRPMNAFMVWGQAIRRELHNKFSNVQNAILSKALGRVWKRLGSIEKEPYMIKASIIKSNHKRDYPNYRYQPRRIQEKQRRSNQQQTNRNLKQLEQQKLSASIQLQKRSIKSQINISSPSSTTSQIPMVQQQLVGQDFVEQEPNIKLERYEADSWRAANVCAADHSGDGALGQAIFHQADESSPTHDVDLNNFQKYAEYTLPLIEPDRNDDNIQLESQTNHIISEQSQIPIDEHLQHQARLFYGRHPTGRHLNQLDAQLAFQDNNNNTNINFCLGHQSQLQPDHSSDIYTDSDSDYRQHQYQQQAQQQQQQQQQQHPADLLDQQQGQAEANYFDDYRQVGNNYSAHYYNTGCRYSHLEASRCDRLDNHRINLYHHDHQQQESIVSRQSSDLTNQTNEFGAYRSYTQQAESYYFYRNRSDEMCPV